MWFIFPTVILGIGLLGLYLNIQAYKKGQTVSLKKLIVTLMLIVLGGGVFLQKMSIINVDFLENLTLAFDSDAREENERLEKEARDQKEQERIEKQKQKSREMLEKMEKSKNATSQ